jgi:hypothetical protein
LTQQIQTSEFNRGQQLGAIVVNRSRRIRDAKTQFLKPRRIVSDKIRLHPTKSSFRGLSSTTHFAQANQSVVTLYFDNGADEPSPVAAAGMAQGRFQWHSYGSCANVDDFHQESPNIDDE